jgi:bisphosphoglycerate-independent phosphoglycerate mutase (AlkP superfamily)
MGDKSNWYNINFLNKITQFVFLMFRGCRAQKLISEFTYNDVTGTADANIFSMFRFISF